MLSHSPARGHFRSSRSQRLIDRHVKTAVGVEKIKELRQHINEEILEQSPEKETIDRNSSAIGDKGEESNRQGEENEKEERQE